MYWEFGLSIPVIGITGSHGGSISLRLTSSTHYKKLVITAVIGWNAVGCSTPGLALEGDVIRPYVSATYLYDDNLRRRSEKESDTSVIGKAGIIIDKDISLQNFYAHFGVTENKYNKNSELNNTGKEIVARWNWAMGTKLNGRLEYYKNEAMLPFADFRGVDLNMRIQERKSFDANWRFHSSWRARYGAQRQDVDYDSSSLNAASFQEDSHQLGVDYLAESGSKVGLVYTHARGTRPVDRPAFFPGIGTVFVNNDYTQQSLKADIRWLYSAKTRLEFLGGYVNRKHDSFSQRDFSGFNAHANGFWSVTDKTSFRAGAWRDANAISIVTSSYVIDSGASASVSYSATSKVILTSSARYQQLKFEGDITGLDQGRTDKNKVLSLGVTYNPLDSLSFTTSVSRNLRDSTSQLLNYNSSSISLTGRYEF
ncbi:outer membrane beta-barrel protein [Methylobacillus flagellatus]|uniref:XrtB/PEP-CTERM-associated polysaccharide biosynthesis outer membrane protein EpsL n=1 Tax=Methylobacillus flagellatus TaxID=405 RepID=UPI002853D29E|nr:XrtB/PEP-CTERM-associated polysaccharide biosynthesis outer membrane protein EpsL [Methylobacillus flagellatus]MDR5172652.1 outer membrane beta-barrel protein [Methylobacillus flagellatus]